MKKKEFAKRLESLGYDFATLSDEHKAIINDCYTVQNEKEDIQKRIEKFKTQITEFWELDKKLYSNDMYVDFFEYWSEHGDNDKRFRKEKETSFCLSRRLKTWARNSKEFSKNSNRMPDVWSQKYAKSLDTQQYQVYCKHLHSLGYREDRANNVTKWIKQ